MKKPDELYDIFSNLFMDVPKPIFLQYLNENGTKPLFEEIENICQSIYHYSDYNWRHSDEFDKMIEFLSNAR